MPRAIVVPLLAALLAAALLTSCAPRQAAVRLPAAPGPEAAQPGGGASEQERVAVRAAEQKIARRDWAGAAVALSDFLAAHPGSLYAPLARLRLAYAYMKLGYFDSAARLLRSASAESRNRVEVLLLLAEAEEGAGKPREAFAAAADALRVAGDRPVLRACQERVKVLGAKLSEADARQLAASYTEGYAAGVVRYQQARLAAEAGHTDEALGLLDGFEAAFPGHDLTSEAWVLKTRLEEGRLEAAPAAAPAVTIGVLVPQEGGFRSVGEQALKGLELATGVFSGPQPGQEAVFRLAVRDCGATAEAAVAALGELVEGEGAVAVVALLGSAHAKEVGLAAQRLQVPLLALCQDPRLPVGGFVFRNFITPQAQVERLAAFARERGLNRLAILHPQDAYGREMAALMATVAPLYGIEVVAESAYNPAHSNVIESIKALLGPQEGEGAQDSPEAEVAGEAAPEEAGEAGDEEAEEGLPFDAVFVPEGSQKAVIVLPQFAYADVRGVTFLGPNLWNDPRFAKGLEDFHEEVYFVDAFHPGTPEAAVLAFVAAYQRAFGEEPGYVAAQSYDDAELILSALRGGATSPQELAQALSRVIDYNGATGPTTIDDSGEAAKSLQVLTLRYRRITRAQ